MLIACLALTAGLVTGAGAAWLLAREQAVNELSRIRARAYAEVEAERAKALAAITGACPCRHPRS
jgi:hypothetical protein